MIQLLIQSFPGPHGKIVKPGKAGEEKKRELPFGPWWAIERFATGSGKKLLEVSCDRDQNPRPDVGKPAFWR